MYSPVANDDDFAGDWQAAWSNILRIFSIDDLHTAFDSKGSSLTQYPAANSHVPSEDASDLHLRHVIRIAGQPNILGSTAVLHLCNVLSATQTAGPSDTNHVEPVNVTNFINCCIIVLLVREVQRMFICEATPLDTHTAFWRERVDYETRNGSGLSMVRELVEGGPIEWVERIHATMKDLPILTPADKLQQLSVLQKPMLQIIGACKRALLLVASAKDTDDAMQACRSCHGLVAGVLQQNAVDTSISTAEDYVNLLARVHELQELLHNRIAPLEGRTIARRAWFTWSATVVAVSAGGYYLVKHRKELQQLTKQAMESLHAFYVEHLEEPLRIMAQEVLGKRGEEVDPDALKDANESLAAMLRNFNERIATNNTLRRSLSTELQQSDLADLARRLDMRTVSERFVIEVQHPLVNGIVGDLVEMMLIQIAFIKKEVLAAMAKMDQILKQNQFNFQMSAMIPAIAVVYFLSASVSSAVQLARSPIDTSDTRRQLTWALRDVQRLLSFVGVENSGHNTAEALKPPQIAALTRKIAHLFWDTTTWNNTVTRSALPSETSIDDATLHPTLSLRSTAKFIHRALAGPLNAIRNIAKLLHGGFNTQARSIEQGTVRGATRVDGVSNDSDGDVATALEHAFRGHAAYACLSAEQLGHLSVLLRRITLLADSLRPTVEYGEWLRVHQDIADIMAEHATPHVRNAAAVRLQSSSMLAAQGWPVSLSRLASGQLYR